MATFSLSSLYPDLLTQVINKLDSTSYFRLQQACTSAGEFIRHNQISLPVAGCFTLQYDEEKKCFEFILSSGKIIALEDLYGSRLGQFKSYAKVMTEHFEVVCELLKKNRIMAKWILIPQGLSQDQCAVLLQILKPLEVVMSTEGTDLFQALLSSTTVRQVKVTVKQDDLEDVMTKLISKFPDVELNIGDIGRDLLSLMRTIFSILHDNPCPTLRRFVFTVYGYWNCTSEELATVFRQFNLSQEKYTSTYGRIFAKMDMPRHFPTGSSCQVTISNSLKVLYLSN